MMNKPRTQTKPAFSQILNFGSRASLLIFFALTFFPVPGFSSPADSRSTTEQWLAVRQTELPSAHAITPNFEDIVSTIHASAHAGHETIADVLSSLKEQFPEFFQFYVMNYASQSLQGSSYQAPRVILHGNGNTFLAFNGDPLERGYGNLEVIEFKGDAGYEFHSVHFAKDGPPTPLQQDEVLETIGTIEISKANPSVCLTCHSSSPRPIWDPYVVWPGFYGADDDGLFLYGRAKSDYAPFDGADKETPAYKEFRKHFKEHPRYRTLDGILTSRRVLSDPKDRINLNVTKIFSGQMSRRLISGLEHNEEALETIGAIEGCRSNYLPDELTASTSESLQRSLAFQRDLFEVTIGSRSDFSPAAIGFMSGPRLASNMTAYELAMKKYANRDLKDFSYTRLRGYDLQDGDGGLHQLHLLARQALKQNFGHDVDFYKCQQFLQRLMP